jgi:hypothetical protein
MVKKIYLRFKIKQGKFKKDYTKVQNKALILGKYIYSMNKVNFF